MAIILKNQIDQQYIPFRDSLRYIPFLPGPQALQFHDDVNQGCLYLGGRKDSYPLYLSTWEARGASIAFHTELFPSLLSCKGAFSGFLNSFVQENLTPMGVSPQIPILTRYSCETNILSIVLLKKSLKTKIYPCGGKYIYIDVPSGEVLLPLP